MRRFFHMLVAVVFAQALAGAAKAQDTIRLDDTGDAKVQDLLFDGQADTEQVYFRAWGYRPFAYRPYAYRAFAYRPFAYRPYYRPYLAYGPYLGYRPWLYARNFYGGLGGYGSYYSYPAYSYSEGSYATDVQAAPYVLRYPSMYSPGSPTPIPAPSYAVPIPGAAETGFFYDGGPSQLMPYAAPGTAAPIGEPRRPSVPLDGRLISIPAQPKYSYPAYGEDTHVPAPAPKAAGSASTVRLVYPAYGER